MPTGDRIDTTTRAWYPSPFVPNGYDSCAMAHVGARDQRGTYLATAPATRREKRVAFGIAVAALLLFAAAIPFARVPLPRLPAFIPSYEAALFFIDLITAVLLLAEFTRLRSLGILALACGYFFDALMIVPHALTFPGAFSPSGLLGAKAQTTAWLYVFWHGGFPLFVIGYAVLRRIEEKSPPLRLPPLPLLIGGSAAAVAVLAVALTLIATAGHDRLPVVMQGSDYSLLVRKGISPAVWVLTLVAALVLWSSKQRAIDLWLSLVMWIWLFDIALSAIIGSTRFDLGFYVGRVFGLIAAGFLLATLVIEMARLHAEAIAAAASAEARLAQLGRRQPAETGKPRRARADTFVQRQNIAHYRSLLESGSLDADRRRSIERLLAEEEIKARSQDGES